MACTGISITNNQMVTNYTSGEKKYFNLSDSRYRNSFICMGCKYGYTIRYIRQLIYTYYEFLDRIVLPTDTNSFVTLYSLPGVSEFVGPHAIFES